MWDQSPKPQTALYAEPEATALKQQFARALLRNPDNPFAAAREIEDNAGRALWISDYWTQDQFVLDECARLRAEQGPIAKVPTKEELAAELYKRGSECKAPSDQLRFFEFFAKIMGYVEKGDGVNVSIHNGPKIMQVPVIDNDDAWQRVALNHQQVLTSRHGT